MSNTDNKIQIYKMRINTLIDEHADALVQSQEFYKQLQEANTKIAELENELRNRSVQKENSEPFIINHPVETINE